jgi:hypothetical protein
MTQFKIVHNAQTGEVSEIPLTSDEIAQKAKDEADAIAMQQAKIAHEAQKAAALEKLGLTAEELAALLS